MVQVTWECPACKQARTVNLANVLDIELESRYIGTGEYVPRVECVHIVCPTCEARTQIC